MKNWHVLDLSPEDPRAQIQRYKADKPYRHGIYRTYYPYSWVMGPSGFSCVRFLVLAASLPMLSLHLLQRTNCFCRSPVNVVSDFEHLTHGRIPTIHLELKG